MDELIVRGMRMCDLTPEELLEMSRGRNLLPEVMAGVIDNEIVRRLTYGAENASVKHGELPLIPRR